jgi:hypothetical protein
MVSRDLVPMAEECVSPAGIGKPLRLAGLVDTKLLCTHISPELIGHRAV